MAVLRSTFRLSIDAMRTPVEIRRGSPERVLLRVVVHPSLRGDRRAKSDHSFDQNELSQ